MKDYLKMLIFYAVSGLVILLWNITTDDFLGIKSAVEIFGERNTIRMLFLSTYYSFVVIYVIITLSFPGMITMMLKEALRGGDGYGVKNDFKYIDIAGILLTAVAVIVENILLINVIF